MKVLHTFAMLATLVSLLTFVGCKQEATKPADAPPTASDDQDHAHADGTEHEGHPAHEAHGAGPHDGTVADWGGGKYHVEFTVDHDKQEGTVFILGPDEKTPMPIAAESIDLSIGDPKMDVNLKASPQEGDPEGKASRFVGTHEKLGVVQEYAGTIAGVVDGTPYSGDFKEEPHADH